MIGFLTFAFLQLSSCHSDDKEIEHDPSLDIGEADSVSIDSSIVEIKDSTYLSSDRLLTQFGHSLPVVKITIDEKDLWSEDSGLFVVTDEWVIHENRWQYYPTIGHWKLILNDTVLFNRQMIK